MLLSLNKFGKHGMNIEAFNVKPITFPQLLLVLITMQYDVCPPNHGNSMTDLLQFCGLYVNYASAM